MEFVNRSCPCCLISKSSKVWVNENFDFNKLNDFAFASRKMPEYMHYRILQCNECQILYSSPIPESKFLESSYHEADFDSKDEAQLASATYVKIIPKILKCMPSIHSALDIGTGEGAFLKKLLSIGVKNVIGVEPSINAINQAEDELKKKIMHGFFDKNKFDKKSFDLITCFQTLEHLENPKEFILSAYELLKPGGCLFIVCHNYKAMSAKLLKTRSPIYDIEHLQLFSKEGAKSIFTRCGFNNFVSGALINSYPLYYWFKLFPFPLVIKTVLIKILKKIKLGNLIIPLPAGNFFAFAFKPLE